MVHFSKFRLSGFKSFVDLTEVEIGPGLNGVVGPNGCGKSNLLEALRWVMGETSAKKMRGGGMEDVIFAGTEKRPPRSAAEVSLFLDNTEQDAPQPFQNVQDIQITRRIERDKGSLYKVNGKTVRARDVQMLFADTVSGANSPALVSQGKITTLINAKPHERRHVLEESAGVAGLYTRRHEAELRLRAAETNLARMDDSMHTSKTQLANLRRQATTASKYKDLSEKIRRLEMVMAWHEWRTAQTAYADKNNGFQSLETEIAKAMTDVSTHHNAHEKAIADLPALRDEDMKLQAKLQALRIEQDRLAQDQKDLQEALHRAEEEKAQLEKDIADSQEQILEAKQAIEELNEEETLASQRMENAPNKLEEQKQNLSSLQSELDKLERQYQEKLNEQARIKAEAKEVLSQYEALSEKRQKSENRIADMTASLERVLAEKAELGSVDELKKRHKDAMDALERMQAQLTKSRKDKEETAAHYEQTKEELNQLRTDARILEGEISSLENLLASVTEDEQDNILEQLNVESGYEKALSRALGDLGLSASLNEDDNVYWTAPSAPTQDINEEIKAAALHKFVKAPEALAAALSSIYVLDSAETAKDEASKLQKGETLVTKDGDLYRWDGLRIKHSAKAETSGVTLEHKNRLQSLQEQQAALQEKIEKAEAAHDKAAQKQSDAETAYKEAAQDVEIADTESKKLYRQLQELITQIQQIDMRAEHAKERLQGAKDEFNDLDQQYKVAKEKLSKVSEETAHQEAEELETLKTRINNHRETLNEKRSDYDVLKFQLKQDEERAARINQDRTQLTQRLEKLKDKTKQLTQRVKESSERIEKYNNNPIKDEQKSHKLFEQIAEIEEKAKVSSDKLASFESHRADSSAILRESEQKLSTLKEKRAALQTEIAALQNDMQRIKTQIHTDYEIAPAALGQKVAESYGDDVPPQNQAQAELIRLKHSRESIGPVNLRADLEAAELEESLSELEREYDDLIAAIEQLRKGIAKLNKEARERIREAFLQVNAHFQKLFTRLFNGGQAHLEMIESDDPLEAGLEIFAQPPGKSLQSLSLLSGGEQTMASIALIFAMFMTNPSPICVLDEIDAPLDDSNVDRMCDLLEDIAKEGKTRFMVITHHRMTMARMDRLYGVTMSEKGVSKLVSVDLATQASFIDQLTA